VLLISYSYSFNVFTHFGFAFYYIILQYSSLSIKIILFILCIPSYNVLKGRKTTFTKCTDLCNGLNLNFNSCINLKNTGLDLNNCLNLDRCLNLNSRLNLNSCLNLNSAVFLTLTLKTIALKAAVTLRTLALTTALTLPDHLK
jgi:hypothetical protein